MPITQLIVGAFATLLLASANVLAQDCLHKDGESADQRGRREAAIRYLVAVNTAQARFQAERGRYVPLNEMLGLPSTPVGFVPRLLFDQWHYVIRLSDFFDACGFTLFSDEGGVIYESYPRAFFAEESNDMEHGK